MKKSTKIFGMIILLTCSIQASANSMFLTFVMVSSLVSKLGYSLDPKALAKIVNLTAEEFIERICKSLTEKTKSNEDKKQSTDLASLFEEPTPTDEQEAWFKALAPESYDTIRRHPLYESVFLPLFPALAPPVAAQDSNSSPRNNDTPQLQEENSLAVDISSEHSYSSEISYDDENSKTTVFDQFLYKEDGDEVALANNNNPIVQASNNPIVQASNNTRSMPLYGSNYLYSLPEDSQLEYLKAIPETDQLCFLHSLFDSDKQVRLLEELTKSNQ